MNKFKNIGVYIVVIVLAVSLVNIFINPGTESEKKTVLDFTYSQLLQNVADGKVKSVEIDHNEHIKGVLADGKEFATDILDAETLPAKLAEKGVEVKVIPPKESSWYSTLLISLLPTLLLVAVWIFFMNRMQGGGRMMDFARSKAKMFLDNRKKVTFADVAGCDEAKEELMEIVEFLKKPDRFANLGARVPKGVLLLSSPGTGKTLLARACAGEAEVPFFSISGSDFVEMFVGVGAARVRDMFDQAHKMHPCIIFIDEIDAVGRQRGTGLGGGHDEREQTLNQLLIEMDGFEDNSGIIVIAATNRADVLDPALLRSGRFDRQIVVDVPDVKGREAILRVHLQNKKVADGVDIATIAKRTPGFVGADLENITNEAALLAARHGKEKIEMPEFEEAIDKVIAGPERKSFVLTERDKKITACHEAGHAVVASKLDGATKVHKVSIIPRGRALGLTWQIPDTDKVHIAKSDMLNEITTLLGGRCAEVLKFKDVTTGASNDLERATQAARDMVTRYGMSEKLGLVVLGRQQHEVFLGRDFADESKNYSGEIAYEIDKEVRSIIDGCFAKAKEILEANEAVLDDMTTRLLEKEVLEGNELAELLGYPPEEEPEKKDAETAETDKNAGEQEQTPKVAAENNVSENTEA